LVDRFRSSSPGPTGFAFASHIITSGKQYGKDYYTFAPPCQVPTGSAFGSAGHTLKSERPSVTVESVLRHCGDGKGDPSRGRQHFAALASARAQPTSTRRTLIGRSVGAGAALAVGGTALLGWRASAAAPAPSATLDQKIFNFALLLEYLQAAFYSEAVDAGALRGEIRSFAEIVADHERQHVAFLEQALGAAARDKPAFDFGSATKNQREFLDAAVLLENTGVAAYNGQGANLTKRSLAAAAQIASVEGRHAAWISDLAGRPPAPRAADPGATAAEVEATLRSTGFIKSS
jgi:Ferritin-like domain